MTWSIALWGLAGLCMVVGQWQAAIAVSILMWLALMFNK